LIKNFNLARLFFSNRARNIFRIIKQHPGIKNGLVQPEKNPDSFVEATADNFLRNIMPAHFHTVRYTGKREFDIRYPEKKKMDPVAILL